MVPELWGKGVCLRGKRECVREAFLCEEAARSGGRGGRCGVCVGVEVEAGTDEGGSRAAVRVEVPREAGGARVCWGGEWVDGRSGRCTARPAGSV